MMARPKTPLLTEGELRLMDIVWDKGSATVKDVVDALPPEHALAYTTVMTTLQTLAQKGVLRHEKQGRAYIYYPVVSQDESRKSAVNYVLKKFFDNSPELLMLNILEHDELDENTVARLKALLEDNGEETT